MSLILVLAGLQQKDRSDILSVAFLLDVSDSLPPSQQLEGIARMNAAIDELQPTDEFSVILFASQAAIRFPMQPKMNAPALTPEILSDTAINRDATNLAGAIRLGMMGLPEDRQRRIVLLSDGLQNRDEAEDILDLVRASEIEVFTMPLSSEREYEVWVRDLQVPSQVRSGETFPLRAIIESTTKAPVTTRLYRDNAPVMPAQAIELKAGIQVIDAFPPQQIFEEGNYEYRVEISVPADSIPENNTAYGLIHVRGRPHILYVEGDMEYATPLKTVLEANRFTVEVIPPSELPTDLVSLQSHDTLILSNLSADELSESQMELIESYVRDLGKGLVVIGGDRAFGRGGYHDTPLERALPVDMTPKGRKESVALMLVIDASGSMANYVGPDQKIQLAIEGVRAAVRALDEKDRVGVIGFAAKIKMEIAPTTDHELILHEVGELRPGSGTKMYPALKGAYDCFKGIDAKQKHIVLLSDGKSEGDFISLAQQIAADKIAVTTIAIGDADQELMQAIAEAGSGSYKEVRNVSQLPKVMAEEARQTQKYTIQEPFQPVIGEEEGSIAAGIDRLPKLYGYIATSEKEHTQVYIHSHEDHPILAAWNYGLGRAVAFTSDVKPGWGADWIEWENFGKFWGQVVNWALPPLGGSGDFDLHVSHHNGRGQIVIDVPHAGLLALSNGGKRNGFDIRVARPNGGGESVDLQRVTPTRYEGAFSIRERGAYLVTAQKKRGGKIEGSRSASLVLSYPAEFAEFEVNRQLLNELASRTNGIYSPSPEQIAHHAGEAIEHLKSLSGLLLMVSVFLFVLEMILRRFTIASGYLSELRTQLGSFRRREGNEGSPTLTRLSQTKAVLGREVRPGVTQRRLVLADAVSTQQASVGVHPQMDGNTERLLEAKRRARAGRVT